MEFLEAPTDLFKEPYERRVILDKDGNEILTEFRTSTHAFIKLWINEIYGESTYLWFRTFAFSTELFYNRSIDMLSLLKDHSSPEVVQQVVDIFSKKHYWMTKTKQEVAKLLPRPGFICDKDISIESTFYGAK
jgi:hypothetical protein